MSLQFHGISNSIGELFIQIDNPKEKKKRLHLTEEMLQDYTILNSAPYVEIDMRSGEVDGYDAIFLSVHKFLGGPGSPGILLMSKALYRLGSFPPSTCGEKWGTKEASLSMDLLLPLSSMTSLAFKREAGALVPVHMVMPYLASVKLSPMHLDVPFKR